jgi:ADP-heptose:LPS heptosyltransferase
LPKYLCESVDDFKNIRPAYLLPDYDLTSQIQKSYKKEGKVLCGISWKSNNPKQGPDRSIELKEFISGLNIPEFEFINLQYGDVTQDLEQVQQELGIKILQAKEVDNFSNIDGLAALIDACDLIISIDNSTVHIAGAIGKPVWVLLNANPDWRWFLERSDSLWYASATLFRQEIPGQWQTVLKQAKDKAMDILQGNLSA